MSGPGTGAPRRALARAAGTLAALALLPLASAGGQGRATTVRDGLVRFTFTLRPGVCGQGQNIWRSGSRGGTGDSRGARDVEYDVECEPGPGRVVLEKSDGEVRDVRFYVGGRWKASPSATDLGALPARVAASLLLAIVNTAPGKAAERAIFPLTVLDSAEVDADLLRIARDGARPSGVRKQAVFWLGQVAEERATAGLKELVGDAAVDREVQEQAIFALSQRPRSEGVPALIQVVRTNRDPQLRRRALFWLGQSGDPRAVDLIEELLAKK